MTEREQEDITKLFWKQYQAKTELNKLDREENKDQKGVKKSNEARYEGWKKVDGMLEGVWIDAKLLDRPDGNNKGSDKDEDKDGREQDMQEDAKQEHVADPRDSAVSPISQIDEFIPTSAMQYAYNEPSYEPQQPENHTYGAILLLAIQTMYERHIAFLKAEQEQRVYMGDFEAQYSHWINTKKDFSETDVRDYFRRVGFIDECRELETQTQTAKAEFKTALERYSAIALRTGPDFEDDPPEMEGEVSRQLFNEALVSNWQHVLDSVDAAPPGDRTPLPVDDQEVFLEGARSIQPGLSFHEYPWWGYYGGVSSGWVSIIAAMARGTNVPVSVGPKVQIPEDREAEGVEVEQATRLTSDEMGELSYSHGSGFEEESCRRHERARTNVNDGSQSGSIGPCGLKRKHQNCDGNSPKRMKKELSR